jgi:arsenite methyltransferase
MTQLDLTSPDAVHEAVRARYAEAATQAAQATDGACCGEDCCAEEPGVFGPELYSALERDELPSAAVMASLGCGNPIAVAELREGERVLDLGSGGGIDVLLSARRVGPTGRAFGLDMTDEMLALAQRNAAEAGATNVEFLKGHIEAIPLPTASVDVVISNCVINLAADKPAVFREIARVLRPGGRMGVTDVVADDSLSMEDRLARGSYTGCIAGALSISEFRDGLAAVGLTDIAVEPTHAVADRMASAIVRARKPLAGEAAGVMAPTGAAAPMAVAGMRALPAIQLLATDADAGCGCGDGCCS